MQFGLEINSHFITYIKHIISTYVIISLNNQSILMNIRSQMQNSLLFTNIILTKQICLPGASMTQRR